MRGKTAKKLRKLAYNQASLNTADYINTSGQEAQFKRIVSQVVNTGQHRLKTISQLLLPKTQQGTIRRNPQSPGGLYRTLKKGVR